MQFQIKFVYIYINFKLISIFMHVPSMWNGSMFSGLELPFRNGLLKTVAANFR